MNPLRWGILGAARIARQNWKAIFNSRDNVVTAVAARDRVRAEQFVRECQAQFSFTSAPVVHDGYDSLLSSSAADQSYGDKPIANIGSGIGSRGVLRFPVPSGSLRSLKLRVLPVVNDADCGAPCKSCAAIEKAGSLDLHYLVSNWVETEVTWNQKNKAAKIDWEVAGAGGPGDRSASVLTASFAAGKELVFEITRPDSLTLAEKWRAGNKLSFLLVPHQGNVLVAATREQASKGCQPDVVAPSLEISSCK